VDIIYVFRYEVVFEKNVAKWAPKVKVKILAV